MGFLNLFFSTDRPRWVFVASTTAFALMASAVTLWLADCALGGLSPPVPPGKTFVPLAVTALLLAPLFENAVLSLLVEGLLTFTERKNLVVALVAILSAIAHGVAARWMFISGAFLFATMAYSYLLFLHLPYRNRFAIIFSQHALFNLPASALTILAPQLA